MNSKLVFFILVFSFLCVGINAQEKTNFKPRYASMTSSLINLRTGPGMQYPIEWIYKKRDYPVEIVDEYDVWRKVKEIDGTMGWIHQSMLSSRRYGLTLARVNLTKTKDDASNAVAIIDPNVVVKIIACPKNTNKCRVEIKGKHGFIERRNIWGLYQNETF